MAAPGAVCAPWGERQTSTCLDTAPLFYTVLQSCTQCYTVLPGLPAPAQQQDYDTTLHEERPLSNAQICGLPTTSTPDSQLLTLSFSDLAKGERKEMGKSGRWNNAIREQRHSRSSIQMQVGSLTRCYVQQKQGGCLRAPPRPREGRAAWSLVMQTFTSVFLSLMTVST